MRPCELAWLLLTTVVLLPTAYGLYMARSVTTHYLLQNVPAESVELLLNSIAGDDDESLLNLARLVQFNGFEFAMMFEGISHQAAKRLVSAGQSDLIKKLVSLQALRSSLPLREYIIANLPLTGEMFAEHGWEPETLTAHQGQRVLQYLSSPGYLKIRTFNWCCALLKSPIPVESWFNDGLWHLYPAACLGKLFDKQPSIARAYQERLELLPKEGGLYFLGMVRMAIAIASLEAESKELYAELQRLVDDAESLRFFKARDSATWARGDAFDSLKSALTDATRKDNSLIGTAVSFELAQYMHMISDSRGQAKMGQFMKELMGQYSPSELPPALLGEFLASMGYDYYRRIRPETWPVRFVDGANAALPVRFLDPSVARLAWSRFIVELTPLKYFEESPFTDIMTDLGPLLGNIAMEDVLIPMYKYFLYEGSEIGEKQIQLAEAASLFVDEAFKLGLIKWIGEGVREVKFNCQLRSIKHIRPLLYSLFVMVAAGSLPRIPITEALYNDISDPTKVPSLEPADMLCYNRESKLEYVDSFYKAAQNMFTQLFYEYF